MTKPESAKSDEEKAAETKAAVDNFEKEAEKNKKEAAAKKAARKAALKKAEKEKKKEEKKKLKEARAIAKAKINKTANPDGTVGPKEEKTADQVAADKLASTKFKNADEAKKEISAPPAPLPKDPVEANIVIKKREEEAKVDAVAAATS